VTIPLDLLVGATTVRARPLPIAERAGQLAHMLVPRAACGVVVDLANEDGVLERVAVELRNARMAGVAARIKRLGPSSPEPRPVVESAMRLSKPHLVPIVDRAEISRAARSPAHAAAIRATGIRTLMVVPLHGMGRSLGILWLVGTGARAAYDEDDLAIAQTIGNALSLAIEGESLARAADEAARVRDDILSITSHELRTPLTSLALQLELLRRGGLTSAKRAQKLRSAKRQVDRMTRLAHDLLDLPRLDGQLVLAPAPMDLAETVRDAARAMEEEATRLGCTIEVHAPSPVLGTWDLFRVEQVVVNLLSNALKYGQHKPVVVEARRTRGRAILVVEDRGIGIRKRDHDRIFGRFERAVSPRRFGGLGLGLFIVRRVVEAHGGTVRVESEIGEGARFVVELPIATRRLRAAQADTHRPRVLS
jgi:signal transduction histidine kinase